MKAGDIIRIDPVELHDNEKWCKKWKITTATRMLVLAPQRTYATVVNLDTLNSRWTIRMSWWIVCKAEMMNENAPWREAYNRYLLGERG